MVKLNKKIMEIFDYNLKDLFTILFTSCLYITSAYCIYAFIKHLIVKPRIEYVKESKLPLSPIVIRAMDIVSNTNTEDLKLSNGFETVANYDGYEIILKLQNDYNDTTLLVYEGTVELGQVRISKRYKPINNFKVVDDFIRYHSAIHRVYLDNVRSKALKESQDNFIENTSQKNV
jgi:hypothetical protein